MSEAMRNSFQDDLGYEILNGKIINMSPASTGHTAIVGNIYMALRSFLHGKPCRVFVDGLMVHLSEKDKFVPDVMVVCRPEIIKANGVYGAPDLVVEILSPRTAFQDRGYKRDLYERNGVREYWIVDVKNRTVEVYRLSDEGYVLHQAYIQHTFDDLELFTEEERQQLPQAVHSCIFPELSISFVDIFENI